MMEDDSVVGASTTVEEEESSSPDIILSGQKARGRALDACRAALGEVNLLGNVLGLLSSSHHLEEQAVAIALCVHLGSRLPA
jgi:hypothetical protein